MSLVPELPLDEPGKIQATLLQAEWGYASLNGQVFSWTCPLCSSSVPAGEGSVNGISPKNHHINYHALMAHALRDLKRRP